MKNGLLSHFFIITNTVCKSGFFNNTEYLTEEEMENIQEQINLIAKRRDKNGV